MWLRFDDAYDQADEVDALSDGAHRLLMASQFHCARNLTNGVVATARAPRLTPGFKRTHITALVDAGLWAVVEGGWYVSGFLDNNPTREEVEETRRQEREKKQRQRAKGTANAGRGGDGRYESLGLSPGDTEGDDQGDSPGRSPATRPVPSATGNNSLRHQTSERGQRSDDDDLIESALGVIADLRIRRQTDRGVTIVSADAYRGRTISDLRKHHLGEVKTLARDRPELDAGGLAEAYLALDQGAPTAGTSAPPAIAQPGHDPACPRCEGNGWQLDDHGNAVEWCPCAAPAPDLERQLEPFGAPS